MLASKLCLVRMLGAKYSSVLALRIQVCDPAIVIFVVAEIGRWLR